MDSGGLTGSFPSTRTEKLRRKIYSDIQDISFYFRSQMKSIKTNEEAVLKVKENFDNRIKCVTPSLVFDDGLASTSLRLVMYVF